MHFPRTVCARESRYTLARKSHPAAPQRPSGPVHQHVPARPVLVMLTFTPLSHLANQKQQCPTMTPFYHHPDSQLRSRTTLRRSSWLKSEGSSRRGRRRLSRLMASVQRFCSWSACIVCGRERSFALHDVSLSYFRRRGARFGATLRYLGYAAFLLPLPICISALCILRIV